MPDAVFCLRRLVRRWFGNGRDPVRLTGGIDPRSRRCFGQRIVDHRQRDITDRPDLHRFGTAGFSRATSVVDQQWFDMVPYRLHLYIEQHGRFVVVYGRHAFSRDLSVTGADDLVHFFRHRGSNVGDVAFGHGRHDWSIGFVILFGAVVTDECKFVHLHVDFLGVGDGCGAGRFLEYGNRHSVFVRTGNGFGYDADGDDLLVQSRNGDSPVRDERRDGYGRKHRSSFGRDGNHDDYPRHHRSYGSVGDFIGRE